MSTDQIERSIVISAPAEQVWRAISNPQEFGAWFGCQLDGEAQRFEPGQHAHGRITIKGFDHLAMDMWVQQVKSPSLLSYRWHPYAIDPEVDYSKEETTLVTFTLQSTGDNATLLTVVESGFDKVPAHRRADALRMNTKGWEAQLHNIERHVLQ